MFFLGEGLLGDLLVDVVLESHVASSYPDDCLSLDHLHIQFLPLGPSHRLVVLGRVALPPLAARQVVLLVQRTDQLATLARTVARQVLFHLHLFLYVLVDLLLHGLGEHFAIGVLFVADLGVVDLRYDFVDLVQVEGRGGRRGGPRRDSGRTVLSLDGRKTVLNRRGLPLGFGESLDRRLVLLRGQVVVVLVLGVEYLQLLGKTEVFRVCFGEGLGLAVVQAEDHLEGLLHDLALELVGGGRVMAMELLLTRTVVLDLK